MRAHEFASHLMKLARILKDGPDFDFAEYHEVESFYRVTDRKTNRSFVPDHNTPVALQALLSLSTIDKAEWAHLIGELRLPIDIRARDASRDLLGKVLRLLEQDPAAREALSRHVRLSGNRASPELMRALSSLLSK